MLAQQQSRCIVGVSSLLFVSCTSFSPSFCLPVRMYLLLISVRCLPALCKCSHGFAVRVYASIKMGPVICSCVPFWRFRTQSLRQGSRCVKSTKSPAGVPVAHMRETRLREGRPGSTSIGNWSGVWKFSTVPADQVVAH